jgi:hypothetical protein
MKIPIATQSETILVNTPTDRLMVAVLSPEIGHREIHCMALREDGMCDFRLIKRYPGGERPRASAALVWELVEGIKEIEKSYPPREERPDFCETLKQRGVLKKAVKSLHHAIADAGRDYDKHPLISVNRSRVSLALYGSELVDLNNTDRNASGGTEYIRPVFVVQEDTQWNFAVDFRLFDGKVFDNFRVNLSEKPTTVEQVIGLVRYAMISSTPRLEREGNTFRLENTYTLMVSKLESMETEVNHLLDRLHGHLYI